MKETYLHRPLIITAILVAANALCIVLMVLGTFVIPTLKGMTTGFSCVFILFASVMLCREASRAKEERKKADDCLRLSETYKQQIELVRFKQHDLKNQLMTIQEMLDKNRNLHSKEVSDLIEFTSDQINDVSMLLRFNDTVIGVFLLRKYKSAQEKGIGFEIKSFISEFPFDNRGKYDVVAILSNLLDNAIEASKLGEVICLEIGELEGFIYFSVLNSADMLDCGFDTLCSAGYSTKGADRGYGLANVRNQVMKYGGNIEMLVNRGRVEFRVYLPKSA